VNGVVRSADPTRRLDPATVKISAGSGYFKPSDFVGAGRTAAGAWLSAPIRFEGQAGPVGADGRFTAQAPAVRGATVVAESPDFATAAARLVWPDDGPCSVTLELRPWIVVEGRVLDEDGDPVSGRCVALDTHVDGVDPADVPRLQAQCGRPRSGCGYGRNPAGVLVFRISDQPDADVRGVFRILATNDGPAVLSAWREGYVMERRELGVLEKDVVGIEMRLRRSTATVEVRDADGPVASARLLTQVVDRRENGFFLETDAKGRVEAGRLQIGREYSAGVFGDAAPQRSIRFRWEGQAALVLERAPTKDK